MSCFVLYFPLSSVIFNFPSFFLFDFFRIGVETDVLEVVYQLMMITMQEKEEEEDNIEICSTIVQKDWSFARAWRRKSPPILCQILANTHQTKIDSIGRIAVLILPNNNKKWICLWQTCKYFFQIKMVKIIQSANIWTKSACKPVQVKQIVDSAEGRFGPSEKKSLDQGGVCDQAWGISTGERKRNKWGIILLWGWGGLPTHQVS